MRVAIAVVVAVLASVAGCDDDPLSKGSSVNSKYQPGQVWSYNNRESEPDSRLLILHVDDDPARGAIVHIYIDDVKIPTPLEPNRMSDRLGHVPFSEDAIDRSVKKQVGTRDLPTFHDGYNQWREQFDAGKAGVFTMTVGEAVEQIHSAMENARPVDPPS